MQKHPFFSKRIIAAILSAIFFAVSLDRYYGLRAQEKYYPEIDHEYWFLFPLALAIVGLYFLAVATFGRFNLFVVKRA